MQLSELLRNRPVLIHTAFSKVNLTPEDYLDFWVENCELAMFPTHTGTPEVSPQSPPSFDVRTSEAVRIGFFPNFARVQSGANRSLHATHSVVGFGPYSLAFLESHFESYTPCDEKSPYGKLAEIDGLIALVGCNHSSNTCLHWIEELMELDYHLIPGEGQSTVVDSLGVQRYQRSRYHSWKTPRRFEVVEPILVQESAQTEFQEFGTRVKVVSAKRMTEILSKTICEDREYLVHK